MQPQQKWLRKTNMATGKLKVNFKMPTPSAADRMYAKHQSIRKAAGLPDVDNNPDRPNAGKYSSGSSKPVKRVNPIATPSINEEEQLDELSPATKSSYVAKAKDQIKQSMPFTKKSDEYRDIAKNFIEKRKKGIAKANESVTVGRAGGRGNIYQYDRNPGPKDGSELENIPFNAKTEQQKRMKKALTDLANKLKKTDPKLKEDVEQLDEKKKLPGLWANIHAKRKRGEPPAKPGDKDYPKTLNIESADDDLRADQITTDNKKFPKKMSRKAKIVKGVAKGNVDQFQANPVLDSDVNPQTNKQ